MSDKAERPRKVPASEVQTPDPRPTPINSPEPLPPAPKPVPPVQVEKVPDIEPVKERPKRATNPNNLLVQAKALKEENARLYAMLEARKQAEEEKYKQAPPPAEKPKAPPARKVDFKDDDSSDEEDGGEAETFNPHIPPPARANKAEKQPPQVRYVKAKGLNMKIPRRG